MHMWRLSSDGSFEISELTPKKPYSMYYWLCFNVRSADGHSLYGVIAKFGEREFVC
jgi:hypothetical protein